MSKQTPKPANSEPTAPARPGPATGSSAPAHPANPEAPVRNNVSGRVTHDERGNAVWEWALNTGASPAEAGEGLTQRMKKLVISALSIAEDAPAPFDAVKKNPLGTVKGYSPYDSGILEKKEAPRKKDLRKLSEWLKLKKQAGDKSGTE